mmetsp:Transcript_24333/g.27047  ORF Transcript_24333/g.27047 Transcript_24333/m.27047 type:complete len:318 (+) Transcript_24333:29-982(+)
MNRTIPDFCVSPERFERLNTVLSLITISSFGIAFIGTSIALAWFWHNSKKEPGKKQWSIAVTLHCLIPIFLAVDTISQGVYFTQSDFSVSIACQIFPWTVMLNSLGGYIFLFLNFVLLLFWTAMTYQFKFTSSVLREKLRIGYLVILVSLSLTWIALMSALWAVYYAFTVNKINWTTYLRNIDMVHSVELWVHGSLAFIISVIFAVTGSRLYRTMARIPTDIRRYNAKKIAFLTCICALTFLGRSINIALQYYIRNSPETQLFLSMNAAFVLKLAPTILICVILHLKFKKIEPNEGDKQLLGISPTVTSYLKEGMDS